MNEEERQPSVSSLGEPHLSWMLIEAGGRTSKSVQLCARCVPMCTQGAKSDDKINKPCCSGIPYLGGCLSWQPECFFFFFLLFNSELVCELHYAQVCAVCVQMEGTYM